MGLREEQVRSYTISDVGMCLYILFQPDAVKYRLTFIAGLNFVHCHSC